MKKGRENVNRRGKDCYKKDEKENEGEKVIEKLTENALENLSKDGPKTASKLGLPSLLVGLGRQGIPTTFKTFLNMTWPMNGKNFFMKFVFGY